MQSTHNRKRSEYHQGICRFENNFDALLKIINKGDIRIVNKKLGHA